MEEQWFIPIKTYIFTIHPVGQEFLLYLFLAYMSPIDKVREAQWMVPISYVILDEFGRCTDFDADDRVEVVFATFFEVPGAKIRFVYGQFGCEYTHLLAIVVGRAVATADAIFP
jgi:hypothetical protein